jgi:hypothetical protein
MPRMGDLETTSSSEIRKRGLRKFIIGGAIFIATCLLMYWLAARRYSFHFALIPACLPFAIAGTGLVEVVSGSPYSRLGRSWMELRGEGDGIAVRGWCWANQRSLKFSEIRIVFQE